MIAAAVAIIGATARKRAELNAVGLMLAVAAGALIMPAFADPHPARFAASPLLRVYPIVELGTDLAEGKMPRRFARSQVRICS